MSTQTYWDDASIVELKVDPVQSDNLLQLANHYGSDKGDSYGPRHEYTKYYQRYFFSHRKQKLRILEVGIARGSSLKMWASFFPQATIEGIDINPNCHLLCNGFENISILIGDAKDYDFGDRIYDIIIDDGSHLAGDITATWENLRENVHDETIYVLEDLHSTFDESYLESFHSQRSPNSSLAKWMEDNGNKRISKFFLQISDGYEIKTYEDKIAFVTKRGASGATGDEVKFSFGENWLDYLDKADDESIESAVADVKDWVDDSTLKNKSVIDIGSGSGLSSLSFKRAGCGDLLSIDVDPNSVAATTKLAKSHQDFYGSWDIRQASILDESFVKTLPTYDIVYSWGVLHHTGQMWRAIDNAASLCKPEGLFWISIYNGGRRFRNDLELKQTYNASSANERELMIQSAIDTEKSRLRQMGVNPENWNRMKERGMSIYNDMVDWHGGLPYEVARVSEILVFFQQRKFIPIRVLEVGQGGCSIYLFKKLLPNDSSDYSQQTFIYNSPWSEFTTKRTIMEQVIEEFRFADTMYCETYNRLTKKAAESLSRAIEAEGRMNSGRHLLKGILNWVKRKVTQG